MYNDRAWGDTVACKMPSLFPTSQQQRWAQQALQSGGEDLVYERQGLGVVPEDVLAPPEWPLLSELSAQSTWQLLLRIHANILKFCKTDGQIQKIIGH